MEIYLVTKNKFYSEKLLRTYQEFWNVHCELWNANINHWEIWSIILPGPCMWSTMSDQLSPLCDQWTVWNELVCVKVKVWVTRKVCSLIGRQGCVKFFVWSVSKIMSETGVVCTVINSVWSVKSAMWSAQSTLLYVRSAGCDVMSAVCVCRVIGLCG